MDDHEFSAWEAAARMTPRQPQQQHKTIAAGLYWDMAGDKWMTGAQLLEHVRTLVRDEGKKLNRSGADLAKGIGDLLREERTRHRAELEALRTEMTELKRELEATRGVRIVANKGAA